MNRDYDKARERWHRHLIPDPSDLFDTIRKNRYRIQTRPPRAVKQRVSRSSATPVARRAQATTPPATEQSSAKKKFGILAWFFLILTIIQLLVKYLGKLSE